jgi:hypothetical protein
VIYRVNGTSEEVNPSKVMDYPAPARAIYWGAREKMIEVGHLEPGDAIEVFLFKKGFTYALLETGDDDERYIPPMKGQFYDIVPFWSDYPLLNKVYQLVIGRSKPVQYEFYHGEVSCNQHFIDEDIVYTFSKKNIFPMKTEPGMVSISDVAPKLLLSTSPDWKAKSKWFFGVNEDFGSFEPDAAIKSKVSEIVKGAASEMDSVSRLTHWAADEIRYSGISMGKGEGFTLHRGEMTFTDRAGVCKDKAGMLITMLRAAGFKAYPAMTMAGSRIDYIPADQFNHCVSVVKLSDGKYHLLDPTWVPFLRELWSSAEQQQNYLMGVPEGADLGLTPVSPAENHYIRIKGHSELSTDGSLQGNFLLEAEGQSDASVRKMFTGSYKAQWKQLIEKELIKISPLAEIKSIDFGNPYDYKSGPIHIVFNYLIPHYAVITGEEIIFTPLVTANLFRNSIGHLTVPTGLKERKFPFRDRSSRLEELNEEIKLPFDCEIGYKPETEVVTGEACNFSAGITLLGKTLHVEEKIKLGKRVYLPGDWPEFRKSVTNQNKYAEEAIVLKIKK